MRAIDQSGMAGRPGPPFVVSWAVSGGVEALPALVSVARSSKEVIAEARTRIRADGHRVSEGWRLGRVTVDWRQRWFTYPEDGFDEAEWERSLAQLGADLETVRAGFMGHGSAEVDVGAPSYALLGSHSVTGLMSVPTEEIADEVSARVAEVVLEGVAHRGVGSGFVTVDSRDDPYSRMVSEPHQDHPTTFDTVVHGYYWTVVLGPGHLAALGGLDQVLSDAPCDVVRPIEVAGGAGALCQVTERPSGLDAERIVAWRAYLAPVLRFGYAVNREMFEQLGRMGMRLWIFEGEPAPGVARVVLQTKVVAPKVSVEWPPDDPDVEPTVEEEPTLWIHPIDGVEPEEVLGAVRGVVEAWKRCAMAGRLVEVEGTLRRCTGVTVDTDDDGARALAVQVDFGDIDVVAAIDRLAAALDQVRLDHRDPLIARLAVG